MPKSKFLSLPDPEAPILDQLSNETASSFIAYWSESPIKHGKILHYNVTIISHNALHNVPDDCETAPKQESFELNGDTFLFGYQYAWSNYNYSTYVLAQTSAGYGWASNEKFIITSESGK